MTMLMKFLCKGANITRLPQMLEEIGLSEASVSKKGLGYMAISL